jgi:hypothetical protein
LDSEGILDLTNPIDVPDILATIAKTAEEVVLKAEGRSQEDALKDGYLVRLWDWPTTTDISLKEAKIGISDGASLLLEMRTRPGLRDRIRKLIGTYLPTFLAEVGKELERDQAEVVLPGEVVTRRLDDARRELGRRPDDDSALRTLNLALSDWADYSEMRGDTTSALRAHTEVETLFWRAIERKPNRADYQRDLVVSFVKMSESYPDQARQHLKRALDIVTRLGSEGRLNPTDEWMVEDLRTRKAGKKQVAGGGQ